MDTSRRAPGPLRCVALLALLWLAWLLAPSAARASAAPFHGTGLWITQVPTTIAPETLAEDLVGDGVDQVDVNAGDGSGVDPQFTPALVQQLRAGGVTACAWVFAYGADPRGEAAVAIAAIRAGAQCLVVDAEGQYDGHYGAAQTYVRLVRAAVGPSFPIGLAGQAEVSQHPTFPYSVFLGPGGFNFDLPQIYWQDFGVSVDQAFAASMGANAIYGRPIVPVGQLYNSPSPVAITRFQSLALAYGSIGDSFFSLNAAEPSGLLALRATAPAVARRPLTPPTLRPGADGDEVVWAQELLNAAGAHLPVGGYYGGTLTAHAVASFQSRHHLPVTGILNTATWKLLMRFRAKEPSWKHGAPESARAS